MKTRTRTEESGLQPSEQVNGSAPQHSEIAECAYRFWLERGCPHGSPQEDWFRAEREVASRKPSPRPEVDSEKRILLGG